MRSDIEAINYLVDAKNKVSAHFLINKNGEIYYLVDIKNRAWHAGISMWKDNKDINSSSIGIEIDNSGHLLDFENYTKKQNSSLIKLLHYLTKNYKIDFNYILGHSDIAPYRKIDPGEKFPWHLLSDFKKKLLDKENKHIKYSNVEKHLKKLNIKSIKQKSLYMLQEIGYDTSLAYKNKKYFVQLIKIYQMHHRRTLVSGILDKETYKLISKSFNQLLTI